MTHKTAKQIGDEIRDLLDNFANTATTIPLMCWDTHLTDTTNKILKLCKSQKEQETAKRIKEDLEVLAMTTGENNLVFGSECWQQFWKGFLGE